MIEVYTGGIGKIYLTTYDEDGFPAAPDSNPTILVEDAETGEVAAQSVASLIDSDYPGEYSFVLPQSCMTCDKIFKLTWEYILDSRTNRIVEYLYVNTPYCTVDEIITELGFSSRPENTNYYPYEKIKTAERTSRMMIDNELGFSMGRDNKPITAYGDGADVLRLPKRIISISKVYENDELVYDASTGLNIIGFDIEITETSYGIRIVPANPGDDIDEQEEFDYTGLTKGRFRDGYRYEIEGIFGWEYIPIEIKQATFLLVNDLLCSDSIWRSRYVKKINSGQMSVELSSLSFNGTGNALADSLINKFKMIQAVII